MSGAPSKMPPANVEVERMLLGGVFADPEVLHDVRGRLDAEDFFRADHSQVWGLMASIYDAGQSVSPGAVHDALVSAGWETHAALELVHGLSEASCHSFDVARNASIVRGKSKARELIRVLGEQLAAAYRSDSTGDLKIAAAQEAVFALGDDAREAREVTLKQMAEDALDTLEQRRQGLVPGVDTGLAPLDLVLDGLKPGRVYVLAGRPGSGKSALAWQVADYAACEGLTPALFLSLEMTREELADRFLASRGRVSGSLLKNPDSLSNAERDRLNQAILDVAGKSRLLVDDPPHMTAVEVATRARRARHRHGMGLLVVDYLQLIDGPRARGDSRQEEVSKVSRRLKQIAKELAVPVVACCQLNRAVEGRADRRPMMSDLRESGQIENDADVILLIHRPDYYDENDQPGLAEVIVAKHRGGPTGAVKLFFRKAESRFEPWGLHSDQF